jgi:hypothetical protein
VGPRVRGVFNRGGRGGDRAADDAAHARDQRRHGRAGRQVQQEAGNIPSVDTLRQIHLHLLGYWAAAVGCWSLSLRWARRSQVWMGVLYVAAGVSLVGKGMIGPGIVGLIVLADLLVRGRFDLLRRCGLGSGLLLFALASLPWHHAMALYRGKGWINELIVINNLARFGSGEQEQAVGGFAYYVRTLGVAALPWSAALPAALWAALRWLRRWPARTAGCAGASSRREGRGAAAVRAAVGGGDAGAAELQRDEVLSLPAAGAAAAGGAGRAVAGGAGEKTDGAGRRRGSRRGSGSGCWGWCCATRSSSRRGSPT